MTPFPWAARQLVTSAMIAGTLAFAAEAHAQQFTFAKKKYDARPGEIVTMTIAASGFSTRTAGLNFTVRISDEDGLNVRLLEATSEAPAYTSSLYSYSYNTLRRQGVTSGVIQGNVQELRGALYQAARTPVAFNITTPRDFAVVKIPIDIDAQGRVLVELVSAVDNGVALLGGSTSTGPILPPGREVPFGDLATILIERDDKPRVTDFTDPHTYDGWTFTNPLPANGDPRPIGESIAGTGLTVRGAIDGSYGFWAWDFNRGAWRNPPADRLLITDWRVASDTTGTQVPPIRLRVMTDNHVQSSEVLIQDLPENNDQISIVPTAAGRTYRTLSYVPKFAADDNSDDGMNPYFDLMQFGYGKPGATIALEKMTEWYFDPALLRGRELVYAQSFDQKTDGGWKFGRSDLGGQTVAFGRSRYGIGVTSGGPLQVSGNTQTFSYGYWYAPVDVLKVKANANKWYKVEAMIHGTADNPLWNPMVRLRAYPENNEFFAMQLFAPVLDEADYHVPRPDLDGKPVSMWFQVPPEFAGKSLGLAFDLIHLDAPADGTDSKPALFMKWVTVTQFDAPVLPTPEIPPVAGAN